MPTVLRRLLLWTAVCVISAAPSFVVAHQQYDQAAMVLGVCLFILVYTALTSTEAFERFHRRRFIRRTLYIGYGMRVAISIVFPIALFPDVFAGAISVSLVREILRLEPQAFAGTLAATCISGALLNVIVFAFMGVVYAVQRAFCRPPEEPRGFAVIPVKPLVPADLPGPAA